MSGRESRDKGGRDCWYGKFHPVRQQCQNKARWWLEDREGLSGVCYFSRWCDEHKHDNDVLIEEADRGR